MASDFKPAVTELIERRLVEDRIRGTPAAEVEGAAVLEAAALALWSNPRTVYLLWHLASNGLRSAITLELEAAAALREAVLSSNRPAYAIRDLRQLEQARLSLLQIEGQGTLNTNGGTFQSFTKAINTFLNKSLAPSVRVRGGEGLYMSGLEAISAIPYLYASIVSLHTDVTKRISSLAVCIPNFLQSDVGTYSGITTAVRARLVIEQVMAELETNPTPESARDLTINLLAMKASLKTMGARPDPAKKVSASAKLPAGRALRIRSEEVLATVVLPEPLTFNAASASLTDGTAVWAQASFPLANYDLADKPCVVSEPKTYPVTVPTDGALYVSLGGTVIRVPLTSGPTTLSTLLVELNVPGLHAEELHPDSGRIVLVATSAQSIGVQPLFVENDGTVLESTVYDLVGFAGLPSAVGGMTSPTLVQDVLLWLTSGGLDVLLEEQALKIHGPGHASTSILSYVLGAYAGTITGVTDTVWLEENGEAISPVGLVDVGDYLVVNNARHTITTVGEFLTVAPPLSGLDAPAEIRSGLVAEISELEVSFLKAVGVFAGAGWLRGLASVDTPLALVLGQPSVASINTCIVALDSLTAALEALRASIGATLMAGAVSERVTAERVLVTLRERGFTRAYDFLLRGAVREIFSMDWQTASYAGELVAAAAAVATSDIRWPDRARTDNVGVASVDEG